MSDLETAQVAHNLIQLGLVSQTRVSRTSRDSKSSRDSSRNHWRSQDSRDRTPVERLTSEPYNANHSGPLPPSTGISRLSRSTSQRRQPIPVRPRQVPTPLRAGLGGMLDIDRVYNRRGDRTFAGGQCVCCEEPLEHTLRGERFLQLTCSHVAHEACFYQFISDVESQHCPECNAPLGLDPGRGGNVVDIEKLGNIIRSLQPSPAPTQTHFQPPSTPHPWDPRPGDHGPYVQPSKSRHAQGYPHARDGSNGTLKTSIASPVAASSIPRHGHRQDSSIDTTVPTTTTRSSAPRNPVPAPILNVRSEYPTMTRSKQPQSLTCLITVEVSDTGVRPQFGDQQVLHKAASTISEPMGTSRPPTPPQETETEEEELEEEDDEEDEEPVADLARTADELHHRVDNWHGLDFARFGPLRLHDKLQVGKDQRSWQELECYLFSEMLICVKEKKVAEHVAWEDDGRIPRKTKATLKGSIMIKKHLESVESISGEVNLLSLHLSVPELPLFHLQFPDEKRVELWRRALSTVHAPEQFNRKMQDYDRHAKIANGRSRKESHKHKHASPSEETAHVANVPHVGPPTDHSDFAFPGNSHQGTPMSLHAPIDLIVVIPLSQSSHGIKLDLLRDSVRFLIQSLGPRDRLSLVSFGSGSGVSHITGLTSISWPGWMTTLESLHAPTSRKSGGDVVAAANVAMDILMQRQNLNPVSSIMLISDSSVSEEEGADFVISRAEAAKVSIFSFGLGTSHAPDVLTELSSRTEASYTYVKDWMMLRESLAGCLGSLQSISHQNVKLKLRLPEGSPVRFAKLSGALQVTRKGSGRDAECSLGDLRFGDRRDVLVQLSVAPDTGASEAENAPQDAWDTLVSGLEALGGPADGEAFRMPSVEEVPVLQADLTYGDIMRIGATAQAPRSSLLAITMLAPASKYKPPRPQSLPIPPHASIVQRRMELLTSDMLGRALVLVSKAQGDRAHHLLRETRTILKGLGKGGLPPLPSRNGGKPPPTPPPNSASLAPSPVMAENGDGKFSTTAFPPSPHSLTGTAGIDLDVMSALDLELANALEYIGHATVFNRDARKAVIQAIGVISSQRAYSYRSPLEMLWANRISGVRDMATRSRDWRTDGNSTST